MDNFNSRGKYLNINMKGTLQLNDLYLFYCYSRKFNIIYAVTII